MVSSRSIFLFLAAFSFITKCHGGPLPNTTVSTGAEGSCALGDVVYLPGDEVPGGDACERCACAAGRVACARRRCEPRPGCKAVHRPDHCCPTYQCECEQEGRVYGNGEKLVDPADPCRVCYCQGGEVVCRRIACFTRDDCRPRLVPGRCCPEYDNCPLRGVTSASGSLSSMSAFPVIEDLSTPAPSPVPEKVKQEITIKEITPVSEIPVLTEVKIKEILPSPSVEATEYSSSKAPLSVREATTEGIFVREVDVASPSGSVNFASPSSTSSFSTSTPEGNFKPTSGFTDAKTTEDAYPSKISLSTQDSINSDIYPSNIPTSVATSSFSSAASSTTKAPIIEEEDQTFFDHNPAFPPLPDDLSVLRNHDDEIVSEPSLDGDHTYHFMNGQEFSVSSAIPSSELPTLREVVTTTVSFAPVTLTPPTEASSSKSTFTTSQTENSVNTETISTQDLVNPMLNLRSAIPAEILNVPSSVPEVITGDLDELEELTTTLSGETISAASSTTAFPVKIEEFSSQTTKSPVEDVITPSSTTVPISEMSTTTTTITTTTTSTPSSTTTSHEPKITTEFVSSAEPSSTQQTTSYMPKSNMATEVTLQTELSSLPIETSDQNPPATSDVSKKVVTTVEHLPVPTSTKFIPTEPDTIIISGSPTTEKQTFDNLKTTEPTALTFDSSEFTTDGVEIIQITSNTNKSATIIDSSKKNKNNMLTELINLVGDVASISDHDHTEEAVKHITVAPTISDSEELIPVNAGYKSKNKNFNQNSITEIPTKSKNPNPNKSKIVEIENEDEEIITDSPAPGNKMEPTTRRPVIDNVSDDQVRNETEKKDIEIITNSYVPTISRRPTKVVMKKNSDRAVEETTSEAGASSESLPAGSAELATEDTVTSDAATAQPTATTTTTVEVTERREESSGPPRAVPSPATPTAQ